ncbi:hypothetical protein JCM12856_20270 [Spirochaeta dissipatitropha]
MRKFLGILGPEDNCRRIAAAAGYNQQNCSNCKYSEYRLISESMKKAMIMHVPMMPARADESQ